MTKTIIVYNPTCKNCKGSGIAQQFICGMIRTKPCKCAKIKKVKIQEISK